MYPSCRVLAVAGVVSRKRAKTYGGDFVHGSEARGSPATQEFRNLGRLLYQYAKLDYFPALFEGDPNRPFSEGVRYVELDYLCHNNSPFFQTPLADVRACNRPAALHGSRFAPMCSAHLSPLSKANDALESCFRVPWPYHSHPH